MFVTTIPGIDVLVVCTGNICRSPMAAAFLERRAAERGLDLTVSSAGVSAIGRPASTSAIEVMAAEYGLDIGAHRSSALELDRIARADLIVGMAREHVRETVVLAPDAFPRTFTLKELVRRGGRCGARGPAEPLSAWLGRVHQGRSPIDHLGASPDDDVADPIGQRPAVYERTAAELARLIDAMVGLVWASAPELDSPPLAAT